MKPKASTITEYLNAIAEDKKKPFNEIRTTIQQNIPKGFEETFSYGMIGYVVPHSMFPKGYHCNPKLPLPFINLAAQKHFVVLYHMGIYNHNPLYSWFSDHYQKIMKSKPNMGKSCIRFRNINPNLLNLIGELCRKITPEQWITQYTKTIKKQNP